MTGQVTDPLADQLQADSHKPMSNECLQALRDAAAAKGGKQLTDAERKEILNKFA